MLYISHFLNSPIFFSPPLLDADILDAGPTLYSVSECCAAEVGQTGGASQSHMYYKGEQTQFPLKVTQAIHS